MIGSRTGHSLGVKVEHADPCQSGACVLIEVAEQAIERRWVSNAGSRDRSFERGYVTRRLAPGFPTHQIPRHENIGPHGLSEQRDRKHDSGDDEGPEPGMASTVGAWVHQERESDAIALKQRWRNARIIATNSGGYRRDEQEKKSLAQGGSLS